MGESVAMIPQVWKTIVIVRLSVKTWENSFNQTTLVQGSFNQWRNYEGLSQGGNLAEVGPLDITQKTR